MLHPAAAPLSSAFELVIGTVTAPEPALLTSITTKYVVLAARSMPPPEAENWAT